MSLRKTLPAILISVMAFSAYWFWSQAPSEESTGGLGPASITPETLSSESADLVAQQKRQAEAQLAGKLPIGTRQSAQAQGSEITVQVLMPEDCPYDPTLRVVMLPGKAARSTAGRKHLDAMARGEEMDFEWTSAPVQADGSAILVSNSAIEEPSLILDGEFLYLKKAIPVEGLDPIEMVPELGASLRLTLTTPDGGEPRGEVRLMGADLSGQAMNFGTRVAPVRQGLYRGLAPDLNWMVLAQLEQYFTHGKLGVKLAAGQRREVAIDLQFGCLIEGVVVDDEGQPMPKIKVSLVNNQPWARMAGTVDAKTDEAGRFSLGRVGPGRQTIEAESDGRLKASSGELDLMDGEIREGVELVLSLGVSIAGTVYDPDGQPARNVAVTATQRVQAQSFGPPMGRRSQRAGKAISDKQGRFEITGLEAEKYAVRARKSGRGQLGRQANLRAEQLAVDAGLSNLRLDLLAPLILEGRVVDDSGAPVTAFRIRGESVESGGPDESETFESEQGTFQFEQLCEGRWTISAQADGFHQEETYTVRLPRSEGPLVLVLQREGSIAGQVLTPGGTPVPDAKVRADNGEGSQAWGPRRGPQSEADEEGRFTIEGLAPGTYYIIASADGWADSEKSLVDISAGAETQDIILQMRVGGSLSGVVLEADGSPMTGRNVHWGENAMGFGNRDQTKTDSSGHFEFKNVTPGEWQVSAAPSFEEMGDRMQGRNGAEVMGDLMEGLLTQTVQVRERENTFVELGGEPKAPVKITGRVLYQGEPVENAEVYAVQEGNAILQGMKSDRSAPDGTFELTLDRPGAYVFSAQSQGLGIEVLSMVPKASEWTIDLAIPSGGITGTVLNPEGKPAPGIGMSLQRNDGLGRVRWQGSQVSTDVAGQFLFEGLEPGVYTVRANVAAFRNGNTSLGSELREGLRVTADGFQRADFRLQSPGTLKGSVLGPDGLPQAGVSIFFRDSSGQLIRNLSRTQSDAAGQFLREGLTPGSYTVSARSANLACEDTKAVLVREGKSTQVQLTLENATVLWVSLFDEQGSPQRLRTEVLDKQGVRVEGGMTPEVMRAAFRQGTSSVRQRVGPLPPGTYTVRAHTADGRSTEKEVRINGQQDEQTVSLTIQ